MAEQTPLEAQIQDDYRSVISPLLERTGAALNSVLREAFIAGWVHGYMAHLLGDDTDDTGRTDSNRRDLFDQTGIGVGETDGLSQSDN